MKTILLFLSAASLVLYEATAQQYLIINSTTGWNPRSGLANAQALCNTTIVPYFPSASPITVFPIIDTEPRVNIGWQDTYNVISMRTGQFISTGAAFRSELTALNISLAEAGVCSSFVIMGLTINFTSFAFTNCNGWSPTGGTNAFQGACTTNSSAWYLDSPVPCSTTTVPILCAYIGVTNAPTMSPSRPTLAPTLAPSKSPSTTPSRAPVTSKPSTSPRTKAPTTASPSRSVAPTTLVPTTAPNDSNVLGLAIGLGVGGSVLFLMVVSAIFVYLSRGRKKRKKNLGK